MPWLDRINDRDTRRLTKQLRHNALEVRDVAQDYAHDFAHRAGKVAGHAAEQLSDYRNMATAAAGHAAHQLADYGKHEGAVLAALAAKQAVRAGRAVKQDPVPVIVGIIGVALLANLVFGRRRR